MNMKAFLLILCFTLFCHLVNGKCLGNRTQRIKAGFDPDHYYYRESDGHCFYITNTTGKNFTECQKKCAKAKGGFKLSKFLLIICNIKVCSTIVVISVVRKRQVTFSFRHFDVRRQKINFKFNNSLCMVLNLSHFRNFSEWRLTNSRITSAFCSALRAAGLRVS